MAGTLRAFAHRLGGTRAVPTGQIRLNRSHPLAQGLVGCYVPGATGGIDLTGQGGTMNAPLTVSTSLEGPGVSSTAVSSRMGATLPSTSPMLTGSAWSIYWRGDPLGANTGSGCIIIGINPTTGSIPYGLACQTNWITQNVQLLWNSGGTFHNNTTNMGFALPNVVNSIGGTFDVTANQIRGYTNGVQKVTAATFVGGAPTFGGQCYASINGDNPGTGNFNNSVCFVAYFWNRALSKTEMAWVDAAPYDFLLPANTSMAAISIVVPPGAGPPHGLPVLGVG